jgi:hypothetical protein
MATSTKIRVMISSRCETEIEFKGKRQKLTEVRRALKKHLEDFRLPNQKQALFDCWINEDGTSGAGSSNWWKHCIKQFGDSSLYGGSWEWIGWFRHGDLPRRIGDGHECRCRSCPRNQIAGCTSGLRYVAEETRRELQKLLRNA